MTRYVENMVDKIIRYKIWIVLTVITITIFLGINVSKIEINHDLDIWFNKNDITYTNHLDFVSHFGDDRNLIIIYKHDNLLSESQIRKSQELEKKIQEIKGVKKVLCLNNIRYIKITPFQFTTVKLIPNKINKPRELKDKILKEELFVDNLISKNGKSSAYQIFTDSVSQNKYVFQKVKKIIKEDPQYNNYFLVGGIPLFEETTRLSSEEPSKYLLIAIIVMILILYVIFKSLLPPIIPIVIAAISIVWSLALLNLFGGSINMLTGIIPLVLLVMNVAFSVHLMTRFNNNIQRFSCSIEALKETYKEVLKPGSIAAITTSLAFLAFSFSAIVPIKMFGIFSAAGILLSYALTLLLVPIILLKISSFLGKKTVLNKRKNFAENISRFISKNKKTIIAVCFLILLGSIIGISKLKFESDQVKYLKKSNEVRVANDTAGNWFDGVYPLEIIFNIENISSDSISLFYKEISNLQAQLLKLDKIQTCHSVVSLINFINNFGEFQFSEETMFSTLLSYNEKKKFGNENKFVNQFISQDGTRLRLTAKTKWLNNQKIIELLPEIKEKIDKSIKTKGITHYISGSAPVYAHLNIELLKIQGISLSFSFLIIFIIFIIVFKKPKYFLPGILPNILPVITTIGIMGFLKIPLDVATVLIASISLGIAVDDTVYYLFSYKYYRKENSVYDSVQKSFEKVWEALVITTIILPAGFAVLIFSNYTPVIYLGIFVSLNLMLALAYDFLLLPSLFLTVDSNIQAENENYIDKI